MGEKKIFIITTGCFPKGDAGAVRLLFMAKALKMAGYKIKVFSRGKSEDLGEIDGIEYVSFRTKARAKIVKAIDYFCFPSKVKKELKSVPDLYGVYIYNAHVSLFKFCKRFCKKRGIVLVHDCVEWYSPEEFKNGSRNFAYKEKEKINTEIIDSSFRVIAISRFLEDYYKSKGIDVLRVPVLCDSETRNHPKNLKNSDKLVLFYAGVPEKKDTIGNVLEAALLLTEEERKKIKIVFIGFDKHYLTNRVGIPFEIVNACEDFLEIYGRMPRDVVLAKMEEADFVVLPRDASLRYAKAGFPSKVTESLANATPILCNYSSDLKLYLKNGENAIIAKSHTPEDFAEALRIALELTADEKLQMSKNALDSAKSTLDYRLFAESLGNFFK